MSATIPYCKLHDRIRPECPRCGVRWCPECTMTAAVCEGCADPEPTADERLQAASKEQRERAIHRRRVGLGIGLAIAVAGVVMAPPLNSRQPPGVQGSTKLEDVGQAFECVNRLWRVGAAIRSARGRGDPPARLPDTVRELRCPAAGKPYVYEVRDDDYRLSCPSPHRHGVDAITARAKCLAPVIRDRAGQ